MNRTDPRAAIVWMVVAAPRDAMRGSSAMRNRSLLAAVAILIALGPVPPREQRLAVANYAVAATATKIALDPAQPQIGALTVIEAWRIDSPHSGFGGWSALALTGPRRFLLVSDSGWTARFTLGAAGEIGALAIAPLLGTRNSTKSRRDVESITLTPLGDVVAGFENTNKVRRYDGALTRELAAAKPTAMARWRGNAGAEAMTRLGDGRWLAIAEGPRAHGGQSKAVVFDRVPSDAAAVATRFAYDPQGKGAVTDAATLRDGRVVIVHRRFRLPFGFTSTIALADPGRIAPGARWTSKTIGVIDAAPLSDNFEGVAIDPDAACGCIWMISDDNQSSWQSTILLKLRLPGVSRVARAQKKRR